MRTTTPLAVIVAGAAVTALAVTPALAATTTTAKTTKTTCKVVKDGRLTVTAKVAKSSKTTGGTERIDLGTKLVAKSTFTVGKADSVCLAPGSYTVSLKTTKATVTLTKVTVAKDKVTKKTVTVR